MADPADFGKLRMNPPDHLCRVHQKTGAHAGRASLQHSCAIAQSSRAATTTTRMAESAGEKRLDPVSRIPFFSEQLNQNAGGDGAGPAAHHQSFNRHKPHRRIHTAAVSITANSAGLCSGANTARRLISCFTSAVTRVGAEYFPPPWTTRWPTTSTSCGLARTRTGPSQRVCNKWPVAALSESIPACSNPR